MTEVEYRFLNIDKSNIQTKLKNIGAKLIHPEFKMVRCIFHKNDNPQIKGKTIRVRKEYGNNTLTFKGDNKQNEFSEEIEVNVNDFENTIKILQSAGLNISSTQESLRETWEKDKCIITIDTRPHIEPYVEIESKNESVNDVKKIALDLKLKWENRTNKGLIELYADKYKRKMVDVVSLTENLSFDQPNPFV